MLVPLATVNDELDRYGIKNITDTTPLLGIEGLIKDAAMFITTHFEFIGDKQDPYQLYAFPRINISDDIDSTIPQLIIEAQLFYIIESLKTCIKGGNDLNNFGLDSRLIKMGEVWTEASYGVNPSYQKLTTILSPFLKCENANEFILVDDLVEEPTDLLP